MARESKRRPGGEKGEEKKKNRKRKGKKKPRGAEEAGRRGSQTKNLKRSKPNACFPSRSKEAQSGAGSAHHRPPPGSRKPGEPQGRREGGGGRAQGGAGGGRPPGRRRAGGAGRVPRLRTPQPRTAARTPPGLERAAAPGGEADLGKPRSRRVALSLQPPPAPPAAPPRSIPGCVSRRSSPPWKQWKAAERRRGPRPRPPPPRQVNPFAAPAARRRRLPGGPRPPRQSRLAWDLSGLSPGGVRKRRRRSSQSRHSVSPRKWLIIQGGTTCDGRGGDVQGGGRETQGRMTTAPDAYLALRGSPVKLPSQHKFTPTAPSGGHAFRSFGGSPSEESLKSGSLTFGGFLVVWG